MVNCRPTRSQRLNQPYTVPWLTSSKSRQRGHGMPVRTPQKALATSPELVLPVMVTAGLQRSPFRSVQGNVAPLHFQRNNQLTV